ncbi:uncharacterized protein EV420DRAFT_1472400 [Desarmillaria tabescens]|uniref:Uncharacterized protein n=1 Tax=Armillaria tabescens TaxID=1929756 RepID=A0AA39NNW7_ARMTA|nr:uncharacterized protein EV420DRAFT_1472400 [Desarmillaria tabescens]KAK0469111.1 hypothetical protein EV420DRAFT_1472400 [Desarmillaria tabescens]
MHFSAVGLVAAVPMQLNTRQTTSMMCSPNFEGVGLSVTNSAREWGVSAHTVGADVTAPTGSLSTADFLFQQNGQPAVSYTIKDITNPNLAVAVRPDGTLTLDNVDASDNDHCSTNISQLHGNVAFGCNITSVPSGLCVQIGAKGTDAMFTAPCNGEDNQNFDFWAASGP